VNVFKRTHTHQLNTKGMTTMKRVRAVCLTALAMISAQVIANDSANRDILHLTKAPTPDQLAAHLFPQKTRGIVLTAQAKTPEVKSVSMPILFHFGKTTITEESRQYLDAFGQMMQKEELATKTVIIEGHTDAVGTRARNQRLSERRAMAIKRYLVTSYNIDPLRLFPEGRGESMLRNRDEPGANVNRRVEFLPYQAPTKK